MHSVNVERKLKKVVCWITRYYLFIYLFICNIINFFFKNLYLKGQLQLRECVICRNSEAALRQYTSCCSHPVHRFPIFKLVLKTKKIKQFLQRIAIERPVSYVHGWTLHFELNWSIQEQNVYYWVNLEKFYLTLFSILYSSLFLFEKW